MIFSKFSTLFSLLILPFRSTLNLIETNFLMTIIPLALLSITSFFAKFVYDL